MSIQGCKRYGPSEVGLLPGWYGIFQVVHQVALGQPKIDDVDVLVVFG